MIRRTTWTRAPACRSDGASHDRHARRAVTPIGSYVPERSWKQRLEQLRAFPTLRQVTQFLDRTVRPALDDVAGYVVEQATIANAHGIEEPVLRVSMDTFRA